MKIDFELGQDLGLGKEVVFLDFEATGVDPETDRIVEFAFLDFESGLWVKRVNPGVPIPASASEVHGIYDDDVVREPLFAAYAEEVERRVEGKVLVGYNSRRYDVPLLDAELRRAGRAGLLRDADGFIAVREIDLFAVWGNLEPRTLEGAVRRFQGEEAIAEELLHSAGGDVAALLGIVAGMAGSFPEIGSGDGELKEVLSKLETLSVPEWAVDRAGKFRRDGDEIVFGFGKHMGRPVTDAPDYLGWMLGQGFPEESKAWARKLLAASRR